MSSQSRRLVPVSENIVRELMELSGRIGIPFRELVERILASFVEVSRTNPHLIDTIYMFDLIEDIRKIGGVILPQSFIHRLVDRLGERDLEELREELRRASSWLGLLVKIKRGGSIENAINVLRIWLSDMKVDLIPLPNEKNTYKIVVSSPTQSEKMAYLSEAVVEGVVKAFDAVIVSREVERGVVAVVVRYGTA